MGEFPSRAHQFKPGNCANPKGRPPGVSLTAKLREALESRDYAGITIPEGKQLADVINVAVINAALAGEAWAIRLIYERNDGKPVQAIANSEDGPLKILVVYDDGRPADGPHDDSTATHEHDPTADPEAAPGPGRDPEGDEAV